MLELLWSFFQGFCVGFTCICSYLSYENYRKTKKQQTQANQELAADVEKFFNALQLVTVEQVNDEYLMYDAATQRFVCKAKTKEELWEKGKQCYPDKILTDTSMTAKY